MAHRSLLLKELLCNWPILDVSLYRVCTVIGSPGEVLEFGHSKAGGAATCYKAGGGATCLRRSPDGCFLQGTLPYASLHEFGFDEQDQFVF